jgi:hypothetical protein
MLLGLQQAKDARRYPFVLIIIVDRDSIINISSRAGPFNL